MRIDEEDVKLEILDTAGEINLSMKENYSLWPDCFVLVYSIADKYSLKLLPRIRKIIEETRKSTDLVMMVLGNKSDLSHMRQVSRDKGRLMAEELGCEFFEVSAAEGSQVDYISKLFSDLYRIYKSRKENLQSRERRGSSQRFREAIHKVMHLSHKPKEKQKKAK